MKINMPSSEELQLTLMGVRDCHGLEVTPNDSVIFTHTDDDFEHHHKLIRSRSDLLEEIAKYTKPGEYHLWFYRSEERR